MATIQITRTVSMSLDDATNYKKQRLEELRDEFGRVVNFYIDYYWNWEKLPKYVSPEDYRQPVTWLPMATRKAVGMEAIKLIKITRTRNEALIRKKYNRIYARCLKKKRNHFGILGKKYFEWIKGKRLKFRATKPFVKRPNIALNCDLYQLQDAHTSKKFDTWVKLHNIFKGRYCPEIPTKKYKLFNKYIAQGYKLATSAILRITKDGKYILQVFFKKTVEEIQPKADSKCLGIDMGINKMFSTSEGKLYGTKMRQLLEKAARKKNKSRRWYKVLAEIKYYIGQVVNELSVENYDVIVMEQLSKDELMSKTGKSSRAHRNLLFPWSLGTVYIRMRNKCEANRVRLELVEPYYTSQRCSNCGEICRESRIGERYECHTCGYQQDADINASRNILHRFLCREVPIPCDTKDVHNQQLMR